MSLPEAPSGVPPEARAARVRWPSFRRIPITSQNHYEHRITSSQDFDGTSGGLDDLTPHGSRSARAVVAGSRSIRQSLAANGCLIGSDECNQSETDEDHIPAIDSERQRWGNITLSEMSPWGSVNETDIFSELPGYEPMCFTTLFDQTDAEDPDLSSAISLGVRAVRAGWTYRNWNSPWRDALSYDTPWSTSQDDWLLSYDIPWSTSQDEMDDGSTRVPTESDLSEVLSRESTFNCLESQVDLLHDLEADDDTKGAPASDGKELPAIVHEPEPIDVPTRSENPPSVMHHNEGAMLPMEPADPAPVHRRPGIARHLRQ